MVMVTEGDTKQREMVNGVAADITGDGETQ